MNGHLIQPAIQGVRFIISMVTTFARYPFPGTDIPVIIVALAPWTIYFFWKWCLSKFFNIGAKE